MIRTLGLVIVALGSGVLVGRVTLDANSSNGASPDVQASPFGESHAASAGNEDENPDLDALVHRLEAEAAERRRLEQRVEALAAEVRRLREAAPAEYMAFEETESPVAVETEDVFYGDTYRALVEAGVDESRAREIKRQMDALDLEMMNLQYEATRNGWGDDRGRLMEAWRGIEAKRLEVREVIGEDAYDRYLYAMGQPNRIAVQDVLEGSPAQRAGLEPGDLLLSYDGERLFTLDDLMRESRSGDAGRTVMLEVIRDGRSLQIYMPRGPLGVRSGFERADPDPSP